MLQKVLRHVFPPPLHGFKKRRGTAITPCVDLRTTRYEQLYSLEMTPLDGREKRRESLGRFRLEVRPLINEQLHGTQLSPLGGFIERCTSELVFCFQLRGISE